MITDPEKEVIRKVMEIGNQASIRVCAFGGLAAQIHGSNRAITDLDLLTDCGDFSWLAGKLKFDGVQESDEIITVGRVDIRRCPIKIGEKEKGQFWRFDDEARRRLQPVNIDGLIIDVMSAEDKLVMKATLQRGEEQGKFDIFDLQQILAHHGDTLDRAYISYRAERCNALERVAECLSKNGFFLTDAEPTIDNKNGAVDVKSRKHVM